MARENIRRSGGCSKKIDGKEVFLIPAQVSGSKFQVSGYGLRVGRPAAWSLGLGGNPILSILLIRSDHLTTGRLAAATAWPTRLVFSSGRCSSMPDSSSGNSAFNTSRAFARMMLPPLPEVTRPSTSMCRMA